MQWLIKHQTTNKKGTVGNVRGITKYSDSEDQQGEDNQIYNFRSASRRAQIKTKKGGKTK